LAGLAFQFAGIRPCFCLLLVVRIALAGRRNQAGIDDLMIA
jgi:hypothetical protein